MKLSTRFGSRRIAGGSGNVGLWRRGGCVLLCVLFVAGPLAADIRISETMAGEVIGKKGEAVRTTTLQGRKMRLEVQYGDRLLTMLMDGDRSELIELDSSKHSAEVRKFSAIRETVEQNVDPKSIKSSTSPTGHADTILGYPCADYGFSVRIPTHKNGHTIMVLSGTACVAKEGVGVKEYRGFLSAADSAAPVVLSFTKSSLSVVMAREQIEVYRMINGLGGIPLRIDSTIRYEGFGAGLMNKLAVTKHSQVTGISDEPLPKEGFGIPEGWKVQQK